MSCLLQSPSVFFRLLFFYHHQYFKRCNQKTLVRSMCDGGQLQLLSFTSLTVHAATKQVSDLLLLLFLLILGWPALVSLCAACKTSFIHQRCVLKSKKTKRKTSLTYKNTQTVLFARGRELIGLASNKILPTDTNKTKIKVNAAQRNERKSRSVDFCFIIFVCVEPKWFVLIYCGDEQLPVWRILQFFAHQLRTRSSEISGYLEFVANVQVECERRPTAILLMQCSRTSLRQRLPHNVIH